MRTKSRKNISKISFLNADIEKIDIIINRYKAVMLENEDKEVLFMLEQYEFRREKLYRLLCIELLSLPMESSIHYFPLVQNIAKTYIESNELQPNVRQEIQKLAV
jgi:hypothetical protein